MVFSMLLSLAAKFQPSLVLENPAIAVIVAIAAAEHRDASWSRD
jgi:hypothetical protein